MIELIIPVTIFGLVASITPGPNNIMVTASGSAFGFRRSVPHLLGIIFGFPLVLLAAGLGLGEIFQNNSQIHLFLKYAGAAYLLYLAWRIAQAGRPDQGEAKARPLTFLEAAAFQWVNVKAWMVALSAIPAFTTIGGNYYMEIALITLIFAAVTIPSITIWCMFGVAIRRLIQTPETARIVNLILAGLVALSVLVLFW
ncbi:MAG TPA: LysE family translocator [Hyphomicrobiales bacterium]|nr:LysE family translocator [Hyphomicrobiales bacterium]